jgi:hypothetical protein
VGEQTAKVVEQSGSENAEQRLAALVDAASGGNIGHGLAKLNPKGIASGQCPWCQEQGVLASMSHLGRHVQDGEIDCPVFRLVVMEEHMPHPKPYRKKSNHVT